MSLEAYAKARPSSAAASWRTRRSRRVQLSEHLTLTFEDRLTMQYQVQEMLRAERIFEEDGIREELAAYNPLIPDGTQLEGDDDARYPTPEERRSALQSARSGSRIASGCESPDTRRLCGIADEDLTRENEEKTFVRPLSAIRARSRR